MTESEYKSYNNSQHIPDLEKASIRKQNMENRWGIYDEELEQLVKDHKAYRQNEEWLGMAKIEYRLTDINFHTEVGLLKTGNYDELFEMLSLSQ